MSENKITYEDIKPYEFVFVKVPSLLLGTMIRTNANLVKKFESKIIPKLGSLNEVQQKQLDVVVNMDVQELQEIFKDAYKQSHKKQYKQLASPKATKFLQKNLVELKKIF